MRLFTQITKNRSELNIFKDIMAGLIVGLVSIPIAMGYAQIAGLPVIYGLYGSLFPILVFGILSTSPQFVVGVDAMPAAMVGGILATMAIEPLSEQAFSLVPLITMMVAVWFVIFYFVKAGRIVKYISKPVMGGFISGVGMTIIMMQVPKLFGGVTGTGELPVLIIHILEEIPSFNLISFLLGTGTVLIILVCKKIIPKVPMTVIMMLLGAVLQVIFRFDQYGVKLLPEVASSLPEFHFVDFHLLWQDPATLILESFSIAAVIMAQTLLATGNYALKYNDRVDNNKELLAYAGMNLVSALNGCCPINGSVSRSGIADSFGCRSQLMSISAFFTMLMVILFGTPFFKYLPVPILTGIVMTALIGILEISLCMRLWKTSKREWLIFMMSFAAVLIFGTVDGVMIGCVLSFADVALQATSPPTAFMGRIPGQGNFYALDRNSTARPIKNAIIYRFSGNLIFANIDKFQSDIENAVKEDTRCVVVDARGISNIDITAVDRLVILSKNLKDRGISFYFTEHSGNLNDQIRELGGESLVEGGQVRRTITLALRDVGMEKPYELEDVDGYTENTVEEIDENLAEFEWAFGTEAALRMEQLAEATAMSLINSVDGVDADMASANGELEDSILDADRLKTSWGLIGRFDESEFWDYLEYRLEELRGLGRISEETLNRLEKRIEERRLKGESRLREINPHAFELLKQRRQKVRERIKSMNPREYEHIKKLQAQFYKQIRKKNPDMAEVLKELHDEEIMLNTDGSENAASSQANTSGGLTGIDTGESSDLQGNTSETNNTQ